MGLLAPSASVCHFEVSGDLAREQIFALCAERLTSNRFRSIENSADEYSCGWVLFDDHDATEFDVAAGLRREEHLCFSLREDRRKIPASLLKREVARLNAAFLAEHPTYNRVPKQEREAIRDRASGLLFARTLPVPAISDVDWDVENGLLRFTSLGQKRIDSFQGLFHQTFPELRLRLLTPLARAQALADKTQQETLATLNKANSDAALEVIEANTWLGEEFLKWLLYRSLNGGANFTVNCDGPLLAGQPFSAWLDNRLQLFGSGPEGEQKVAVVGPQDNYTEVCAALRSGKRIAEATLHLSLNDDQQWKLTLKGERFSFAGFRTPMNKPDNEPIDDPALEAEAAFYTKLGAIEEGEQLFGSVLKSFLEVRLGQGWTEESGLMEAWLAKA